MEGKNPVLAIDKFRKHEALFRKRMLTNDADLHERVDDPATEKLRKREKIRKRRAERDGEKTD